MIEWLAGALDVSIDASRLVPIAPDELATSLTDDTARRALVQQLVVLTTLDGEIDGQEVATVEAFASALDVEERGVRTIRQIVEGRPRRAAFGLARRSFMPALIARRVVARNDADGVTDGARRGATICPGIGLSGTRVSSTSSSDCSNALRTFSPNHCAWPSSAWKVPNI